MAACGGGGGGGSSSNPGNPPPPPARSATEVTSKEQASNFLAKASFGGLPGDVDALNGGDAADWLRAEFSKPETLYLPGLVFRANAGEDIDKRAHAYLFWDAMISGDDQLRQRMAFALSQIIVVSDKGVGNEPLMMAYYMDILARNAFGNYRDLLEEITYSPAMAEYLTYLRNRKGDENTGRMPDENYAREITQLFTIGLIELNMDGTPRLGSDGEPIETFDNEDIIGLARVFTGLGLKGTGFQSRFADEDGEYAPLQMYPDQHSELEKVFLGTTIPAGTGGEESITIALDTLFNHPNVAPFVSRQLIQRFTTSSPTPDYIERVATAFENGRFTTASGDSFGTGRRGDLQATLAAVLLDQTQFDDIGTQGGKIREPILRFIHWARAFNVDNIVSENERWLSDTSDTGTRLAQQPLGSPSVFNFYRPGYVAPGTQTGALDLTAPEFQIVNESSNIGYVNFMTRFAMDDSPRRDSSLNSFAVSYDDEIALVEDPPALVAHLDELLTGGRMSDITKTRIEQAIAEIPIDSDPAEAPEDRLKRAEIAVLMAVTSPAFTVQ
jgi:uncharacterized protein (DUF1800 family)